MLDVAVAMGDLYGEVHARYALGIGALRFGSWREIGDQFERGVALCERIGSAAMGSSLDNAMATCELYFGLIPQALARLDRLFPALEEANAQLPMWVTQHARSEAHALLGDTERALEYAKHALRIAESSGGMHHKTASLLVLGNALCMAGDVSEGLAMMDRAVAMRRELATPLRLVEALGVYLEALLRAGRVERAVEIEQELAPLYETNSSTAWRPALLLSSIARTRAATGDAAVAALYFDRARAEFERDAARLDDETVATAYRALPYYRALTATDKETDLRAPEPA
jgi:tetratricopeptide (TPR) repeat protein